MRGEKEKGSKGRRQNCYKIRAKKSKMCKIVAKHARDIELSGLKCNQNIKMSSKIIKIHRDAPSVFDRSR